MFLHCQASDGGRNRPRREVAGSRGRADCETRALEAVGGVDFDFAYDINTRAKDEPACVRACVRARRARVSQLGFAN